MKRTKTTSFGMLGDIIFLEYNVVAFASKKVIGQILNITILEGSQANKYLFNKGYSIQFYHVIL